MIFLCLAISGTDRVAISISTRATEEAVAASEDEWRSLKSLAEVGEEEGESRATLAEWARAP